jgi:hypothetical protein
MKIAFVGNCQVSGMAMGLGGLLPEAEIYPVQPAAERWKKRIDASAEKVLACDHVFIHEMDAEWCGALRASNIRAHCRNVHVLPVIVFTGFHPDVTFVRHAGRDFDSAVGNYHSRLVAAAFRLGYDEETTLGLFNALVMRSLGYFDDFAQSYAILRRSLQAFGFDLDAELAHLPGRVPFMHTINHPSVHLLAAVARRSAITAGLLPADAPRPAPVYDPLSLAAIWPVYPPLARGRGVFGSYSFKRHDRLVNEDGGPLAIGLERLVRDSLAHYRTLPEEAFAADDIVKAADKIKAAREGRVFSFAPEW